ncbi:Hypothetical predicted protein [Olea europaea subsp. europaea]|uniref:Uncharacterized protein n=1 Tax=Olea europaea subsp. europaea TaxID=158383 RepID=A0A8S0PE66_OLEEU|nr:Hypothetical predicted protein [Olea europaea subsp. europaea]
MSGRLQHCSSGYEMLQGGLDSMSGQSQQSSSGFYGGQYGMSQQNSGGHYAGNTTIFHGDLDSVCGQSQRSQTVSTGDNMEYHSRIQEAIVLET